uniref:Uncharacterized protein n=1 Tax=Helianthus annuus TaxID=4232 RepID=A0A251V4P4_HELAN
MMDAKDVCADARYILDAGRRSSSTKDRTRYRYMLPHSNTLQITNNEFNHVM